MKEPPLCFQSHIGRAHLVFIVFEPALQLLTPSARRIHFTMAIRGNTVVPLVGAKEGKAYIAVGVGDSARTGTQANANRKKRCFYSTAAGI